ncbi:MAG: iron-containing alcohol dehydrogenase [Candidatus Thorarchaeota archaeon]
MAKQEKPAFYETQQIKELMSLINVRAISGIMCNFNCSRIYSGKVGLLQVSTYLKKTIPKEDRRAIIITDGFTKKFVNKISFYLDRINMKYKVWSGVKPEAPVPTVDEGVKICEEFKPKVIIGIGGGSVLDTAKMVMLKYEKPEEDLYMIIPFLGSLGLRQKVRYLIAIPTTCAGAETTYAAVATDMLRDPPKKLELFNDELMPDIAILDVDFVKDTPPLFTMATGMDALAHAIGAYTVKYANPISDSLAVTAIKEILKFLPRAYKYGGKDIEARQHMQLAATLSGLAFGNTMAGIDHSLGHSFGKIMGVHHGLSVGLFIPYSVGYTAKVTDKWMDLCPLFGIELKSKNKKELLNEFIGAIKKFMRSIDAPTCVKDLKDLEVDKDEYMKRIDLLSNYAYEDGVTLASPRPINEDVYKKIFQYAYDGVDIDF